MSGHSEVWFEARRLLRSYVRYVLFLEVRLGDEPKMLEIPRLRHVRFEEEDVYEAGRGHDDPPVDDDGTPRLRSLVSVASNDRTAARAIAAAGRRIYTQRELEGPSPNLKVAREQVLAHALLLTSEQWRTLHDLGHLRLDQAAAARHVTVSTVKGYTSAALDALLTRIYAAHGELAA